MDEIEVKASTVEAAIKQALELLGATLDEVDARILDSGSPGRMLGFGARDAKVLVTRRPVPLEFEAEPEEDDEIEDRPPDRRRRTRGSRGRRRQSSAERESQDEENGERRPRRRSSERAPREAPSARRERPEPEPMDAEAVEQARAFVAEFLQKMGFSADVETVEGDPPTLNILSAGDQDMATLIGSRGDTLRQFGFLVSSMLGRRMEQGVRLVIDVDNYRGRREDSIRELATEAADAVRETGRTVTLRVMPGHERRIVHLALADDEEVHTYSIGQVRNRRVVIALRE